MTRPGPPAGRRPGLAARREALLDAADRVVQRDGPAVSMSTIAAEAGITKPILYRHFGDKSGLYDALADRYTARLLDLLGEALAPGLDRRSRVERAVDAYLAALEAEPQVYRFLLARDGSPSSPDRVRTLSRRLSALLAESIGSDTGLPADSLRARTWAHGIVGMVQVAGDWWLDTHPCPRASLVSSLADLLWGGYGD